MSKIFEKARAILRKYTPIAMWCFLGFSLLTWICYLFAKGFPRFADFFHGGPAKLFRFLLAKFTNVFPFSLAEALLLCVPILLIGLVVYFVVLIRKNHLRALRGLLSFASACLAFYCLFVWMFGIGCYTTPIHQRIGIPREDVSVTQLQETASILVSHINELTPKIAFVEGKNSVLPYSMDEMNDMLNESYQKLHAQYSFIGGMTSDVKYVANSHWMSYTHLTGIYTFYTGEANINVMYPDYTIPYTAAHELAHQRGISREDEANFVAFLACIGCEDPYIQYSAYLNVYEYVANQLYGADSEAYFEVLSQLSPKAIGEMRAYSEFYEPYKETKTSQISSSVNDAYLKAYGQTAGVRSYGLVVDLTVAYYKQADMLHS